MLSFKVSLSSAILTFILFAGGIGMETAYGQSSARYANCIMMIMKGSFVQLMMDEDCDEQQFSEAVAHYKANGYPHESSYMDMLGSKSIQLQSDETSELSK